MENEENTVQPETPVADQRGQWFVVHTLSGHEKKVCESITRKIKASDELGVYEAHIPEEKVEEIRMGARKVTSRKLFPGYILVRMDLYDEDGNIIEKAWSCVRGIQGVMGFLGARNSGVRGGEVVKPRPISEEEIGFLLRPADTPRPKGQYKVGEMVRICDGPFENIEGKIESIDEKRGRIVVVMTMMGRPMQTELEFWQVEHVE